MLAIPALFAFSLLLLLLLCRSLRQRNTIAFFHPYCNDGGGGERVLWCAVQALHASRPSCTVAVYTGDTASKEDILRKAKERFGLDVDGVCLPPTTRAQCLLHLASPLAEQGYRLPKSHIFTNYAMFDILCCSFSVRSDFS